MISQLLEQEDAVRVVLSNDRKTSNLIPTWQDIDVLESISKALSPISELTDFLSGENHVTISAIIPVLHNLKTKILVTKEEDTTLTKDIKKAILDDLLPRYSTTAEQQLLSVCTFLNPRFKMEYSDDKENLKKTIKEELLEVEIGDTSPTHTDSQSNSNTVCSPPPPKRKKLATFLKKATEDESASVLSPDQRIS